MSDFLSHLAFDRAAFWPVAMGLALLALLAFLRDDRSPAPARLARLMAWLTICCVIPGPAWRRPPRSSESGDVIFLVDQSLSMSLADSQRSAAERLRLAESLGTWSDPSEKADAVRSASLSDLEALGATYARDRAELDVIELTRRDAREVRQRLAADRADLVRRRDVLTQSAGLAAPATRPLGRISVGSDAGTSGWLADLRRFVRQTRSALDATREERLNGLVKTEPAATDAAAQVGSLSRLDVALACAARLQARLPAGTPSRVLAFGDKLAALPKSPRATALATDPAAACEAVVAGALAPPRAIVLLTDARATAPLGNAPADVPVFVGVVAPDAPPAVATVRSVDAPARLNVGERASVTAVVSAGADLRASVRLSAARQSQVRDVSLHAGVAQSVEFDLAAERAGELPLEISIEPAAISMRVPVRRVVHVSSEVRQVLFVGSPAGWDAQLMLERLRAIPWLGVSRIEPTDPSLPDALTRAAGVIFADVSVDDLSPSAVATIGSLRVPSLLVPDATNIPLGWSTDERLASSLPGRAGSWRTSPAADGSFVAVPTAAGAGVFGESGSWADRPALLRFCPVEQLGAEGTPLLVDRESGLPLVLASPRGLAVLTDQAWRWNVDGSRGADRFWDAVIRRWMPPPPAASSGGWGLDVSRSGDVASVLAAGPSRTSPKVILAREGRDVSTRSAVASSPGKFAARFADLEPGQYSVRLDQADSPLLTFQVGDAGEAELADLTPDPHAFAAFVAPRGAVIPATDLPALSDHLAALAPRQPTVTYRLWDSPAIVGVLLALLTAEWALRRRVGLP